MKILGVIVAFDNNKIALWPGYQGMPVTVIASELESFTKIGTEGIKVNETWLCHQEL